jgi:hypothetical protein
LAIDQCYINDQPGCAFALALRTKNDDVDGFRMFDEQNCNAWRRLSAARRRFAENRPSPSKGPSTDLGTERRFAEFLRCMRRRSNVALDLKHPAPCVNGRGPGQDHRRCDVVFVSVDSDLALNDFNGTDSSRRTGRS